MKRTLTLAALLLAIAAAAGAGEIFGTISEGAKPLAAGTTLKLECGDASATATTDEFGGYSIKTTATGDCRLTLTYKGSSPSVKVTLFEKPSRYDLVVKEDAGKTTLSRK